MISALCLPSPAPARLTPSQQQSGASCESISARNSHPPRLLAVLPGDIQISCFSLTAFFFFLPFFSRLVRKSWRVSSLSTFFSLLTTTKRLRKRQAERNITSPAKPARTTTKKKKKKSVVDCLPVCSAVSHALDGSALVDPSPPPSAVRPSCFVTVRHQRPVSSTPSQQPTHSSDPVARF